VKIRVEKKITTNLKTKPIEVHLLLREGNSGAFKVPARRN